MKTNIGVIQPQNVVTGGVFTIEHVRDGKVIDTWVEPNLVVDEGLNHLLGVYLGAVPKVPTWYVALFEGNYNPTNVLTGATFAQTSTEFTSYTGNRPEWVDGAVSAKQISNSANKATFVITAAPASEAIFGAALISTNAKGDALGVLFAASRFSASRAVVTDDQLLITYTVQAASA